MPTRRQFLKFAGGGSLAAFSWMTRDDGDIREVWDAIPGRQSPRETRERPPTQPMPDFDSARHPDYSKADRKRVEKVCFDRLNRQRDGINRQSLTWSDNLAYIARRHSHEQAIEGWTGHDDSVDEGWEFRNEELGRVAAFGNRMQVYGYRVSKMEAAENTFWKPIHLQRMSGGTGSLHYDSDDTAGTEHLGELAFRLFRESPSHRETMLSGEYDTVGVGAVLIDTDYEEQTYGNNYLDLYVTQVFTGPKEDYEWVVRS